MLHCPKHRMSSTKTLLGVIINQFSEMGMSSRSGSLSRVPSTPRHTGVRMYRDDYWRGDMNDNLSRQTDERRRQRFSNYNDGYGDKRRQERFSNDDDDDDDDSYRAHDRFGPPRTSYRARGGQGGRGGGRGRSRGHPSGMGRRGGGAFGGHDWGRGGNFLDQLERDDFYPDRVSTHILSSSERYQQDWSKLGPRDYNLEAKLGKKRLTSGEINFESYKDIPVETSGANPPEPIQGFKDVNLGEILENNLELSGIDQPTPIQKYSTGIVKAKRDLMACAQTGSGKTAAFLIPILSNLFQEGPPQAAQAPFKVSPLVLILAPTRELASQTFEMSQHFCYRSCVRPYVVYGGSNIERCIKELSLGVEVLVATPGRLVDLLDRGEVSLEMVKYLVLDEADRMLDMGFERDLRTIVSDYGMPAPGPERQTLMYSATFPKPIQLLAKQFMNDYIFLTVGRVGSTCDNISQKLEYVRGHNKIPQLLRVVDEETEDRILVFVRTKVDAEKIQGVLNDKGCSAISIHGNKTQRQREIALDQFRNGNKNILVATEVAARGLDISNISHVINFDMPDTIENYVHRIGRTGRMGKAGKATSFFNEADAAVAPELAELLQESNQEVPEFLANMMRGKKMSSSQSKFGGRDHREGAQFSPRVYSSRGYTR